MCKYEEKICPRCENQFECKVGDIAHCQCYGISFTSEEKAFIEERYDACLCRNCLLELKHAELQSKKFNKWDEKI